MVRISAKTLFIAIAVFGTTASQAFASALVGETRMVAVSKSDSPTADKLREEYRRPKFIPFPKENPYTAEKAALGKKLYFDTRLSSGNLLSCAACHNPGFGWGDGQPTGVGHMMKRLGRRSPTIINAAYSQALMWDGRAGSLEEQALGPIQADVEMAMPLPELIKRLNEIPEYKQLFEVAFPGQGIKDKTIAHAIATYERTVVSGYAPLDVWIDGDEKAISESAKRGFVLFNGKAQCNTCHSGWRFTDDSFHDIGLPGDDIGRGKFLEGIPKAERAFKTPGLREISRRGPYMHDGSLPTLAAVMDHYDKGGVKRESRSDLIQPLGLSAQEKADLVALMHALTSTVDPTTVPEMPR